MLLMLLALAAVTRWDRPVWAQAPDCGGTSGGPLVLMGIDAEDGGLGGHGPITAYRDVVNNILLRTTKPGTGILVIGAG
jgi:hypothetical protein